MSFRGTLLGETSGSGLGQWQCVGAGKEGPGGRARYLPPCWLVLCSHGRFAEKEPGVAESRQGPGPSKSVTESGSERGFLRAQVLRAGGGCYCKGQEAAEVGMRGPGPGPTLVSCTAEKGLSAPASSQGDRSSLPGPWAAQPASQADVTTPRPSRALRLRLPGGRLRSGKAGAAVLARELPWAGKRGRDRERESHAVKNPERLPEQVTE